MAVLRVVHAEQTMSQVVGTIPVVPTGRTDFAETRGWGESSPTGPFTPSAPSG
jgi:hypothetical protein